MPSIPSDVSDIGHSPAQDAALFPSDEQLNQRALWISFLIVLGWSVLGLIGALPMYLVSVPCIADLPSSSHFGGAYSTLEDLSLMRLLRYIDSGSANVSTSNLLATRATDASDPEHARVRVIVLTVLVLVLALLPALYKVIKEFNRSVAYWRRWVDIRCEGVEMGWLSATRAQGFVGWGEKRLKDFLLKSGLSAGMENGGRNRRGGTRGKNGNENGRNRSEEQPLASEEQAKLEVDVQSLFSIGCVF